MAIHRRENQYRGVNAHLHSHFQQGWGWATFHQEHITELAKALEAALTPHPHYRVAIEPSLQIAQYDLFTDKVVSHHIRAGLDEQQDIGKHDLSGASFAPARPTLILPITNLFIEREDILSVVIYKDEKTPVTRLEMISPASKPPGSHQYYYLMKRSEALRSQVRMVELDYLHERRSYILDFPDYTQREPNAYPYGIMVSAMLSPTGPGQTEVYAFHVDELIPTIAIPLDGDDILTFDFGEVYHRAFVVNKLNGLRIVDYEKLPEGFDTYHEDDQQRIQTRMELVSRQTSGWDPTDEIIADF